MSTENLFRFWCRSQFLFSALLAQRAGRIQGWDAWTKGVSVGDADWGPLHAEVLLTLLTHVHPSFCWEEGTELIPAHESRAAQLQMRNL